ncbi:MAG: hypothetical protein ACKOBW_05390 [Planctomycetota bacterium]
MAPRSHTIYEISWPDLFPGLIILRTVRLAFRPSILLLACLGVTLSPLGWRCAEFCFLSGQDFPARPAVAISGQELDARSEKALQLKSLEDIVERNRRWPAMAPSSGGSEAGFFWPDPRPWTNPARNPLVHCYYQMTTPLRVLLSNPQLPLRSVLYLLVGGFWTVALWSVIAGTITRIAVVRLGLEEGLSLTAAFNFTTKRLRSYLLAPLLPLIGVVLISAGAWLVGLIARADIGLLFVGLVWILVLLGGFLLALILIGFAAGWPLMWPAIGAEKDGDEFEALHRSLHYPFRNPLRYLVYLTLALAIGFLGDYVVQLIAQAAVYLSEWAVSLGLSDARAQEVFGRADSSSALARVGIDLIQFSKRLPALMAQGYQFAFFWCAASAIYLVLRLDTDQAEFDQVVRDQVTASRELPPLETDQSGVQQLAARASASATTVASDTPATQPRHEARSDGDT